MPLHCQHCPKEFASSEALQMHQQATHALGGLSKEERQQKRQEFQDQASRRRKQKQIILYGGITLLVLGLIITGFYALQKGKTFSSGPIHWHADLAITICGENIPLPQPTPGTSVHGEPYIGTPFLHLHKAPLIHIEGIVQNQDDITLGRFMEVIHRNFKDAEVLDKKNGDMCPNSQPGRVMLLVNGREDPSLSNKVIVDGERYDIIFE